MLESNAAKSCFDEIIDKCGSDSCSTFTSDNDNKSFNQAKKVGLVAERRFDPRHDFKSLSCGFYKMTKKFEHEENNPDILDEDKTEIISWAVYLVKKIKKIREKIYQIMDYKMIIQFTDYKKNKMIIYS